jgi:hypothetical protein
MKKYMLLTASFLLFLFSSCRKDRVREPVYPTPQEYIFTDDFNNDNNGWSFADPSNYAYGVVSNGTFKFDYNDNYYEAYYVAHDVGFNPNNDFTIQARIGSDNNMGILFGYDANNGTYGYSFTVDYDGYFALYDEGGNGYGTDIQTLVAPQTRSFVNYNGDWNDLEIDQRGSRWIGYINNQQVFNVSARNFRGSALGFVVVANTRGEADYFEAHWLQ